MPGDIQGTQVVGRVSRLLRIVSERAPDGISTLEVAAAAKLTRPTTHRLLASLAAEGFLDHDPIRSRWYLGPELYLMGAIAAERYDITDVARHSVEALATETGESAFLSARRGNETVCLLRVDGSFPVRSFVLYEGVRFPLGVASAGLVILSFLPDKDVAAYLAADRIDDPWRAAHSSSSLSRRIRETRARGYSVNPGLIVEGSFGMAAAIFDGSGRPDWALSLTGIESRFSPDRRPELGRMLLEQAHEVTKKLAKAAPKAP